MSFVSPTSIMSTIHEWKFAHTFNPYVDCCKSFDKPYASKIRTRVLIEILDAAASVDLDAMWVGRDLGYRGGRRTGLALTDDLHYFDHLNRWGVIDERPTFGASLGERTARAVWSELNLVNDHIFLWNIFPLHPFPVNNVFENRRHTAAERRASKPLLAALLKLLKPRVVISIGRDATETLTKVGVKGLYPVRHPSYGGEIEFRSQLTSLYKL